VKNTLAERAGAGTPAENLLKNLSGTNFHRLYHGRPGRVGQGAHESCQGCSGISVQVGVVEGRSFHRRFSSSRAASKDELISKIMFLLNAPAQRIAMALNALPRNLAVTVSEAIKANKFGSSGAVQHQAPNRRPKRLSKFNF